MKVYAEVFVNFSFIPCMLHFYPKGKGRVLLHVNLWKDVPRIVMWLNCDVELDVVLIVC
jgi:hypothetical protein